MLRLLLFEGVFFFAFVMTKTRLSVNINKIATLRNARGGDLPNLLKVALDCEKFGAEGITVHPRPDERHIRYQDVYDLKPRVTTEFNIEGYPNEKFMDLVLAVVPDQCTLVPDDPNQVTSDHGWDTLKNRQQLERVVAQLKAKGIRVSMFIDPAQEFIQGAKDIGADRIEFYTGPFAHDFNQDPQAAIAAYKAAAIFCNEIGIGINAGHDLNLHNLKFFKEEIPNLLEVSIGHALIADALYYGLENTIQLYLRKLN